MADVIVLRPNRNGCNFTFGTVVTLYSLAMPHVNQKGAGCRICPSQQELGKESYQIFTQFRVNYCLFTVSRDSADNASKLSQLQDATTDYTARRGVVIVCVVK